MRLLEAIASVVGNYSLNVRDIPSNEEIIEMYNTRFENAVGVRNLLRRFGPLRCAHLLLKEKISKRSCDHFSFVPADFYAALGRLNVFRSLLESNNLAFLQFFDEISQYYVLQLLKTSFAIQECGLGQSVPLDRVLDRHHIRMAKNDFVAYFGRIYLDCLRNIVNYGDLRFYMYYPSPNAVLYDHGLLDPIGPKLPLEYDAVFDVGGYMGDSAVVLSQYLSAGGKVYSFEPTDYAKYIEKNAKLNDISDEISVVRAKVGADFDSVRLDEFARKQNLPKGGTYLLKADIEGYERYMLEGAKDFIAEYHPVIILAAYHLPDDLIVLYNEILEAYDGYKIYFRHHQSFSPHKEYYYIAIPDTL